MTTKPEVAITDIEAARLRMKGHSYPEIAEAMGISVSGAYAKVQRAIRDLPREDVEEARNLELAKLDAAERAVWKVLERAHVTIAPSGKVVTLEGVPVEDDAPILNAVDRLVKISTQRAKLLGLNAPTEHRVYTVDALDAEISRLEAELGHRTGAGTPQEA